MILQEQWEGELKNYIDFCNETNKIIFESSREHPLSALSHGDVSVVSSFHVGDTFSECLIGDTAR